MTLEEADRQYWESHDHHSKAKTDNRAARLALNTAQNIGTAADVTAALETVAALGLILGATLMHKENAYRRMTRAVKRRDDDLAAA